MTEELGAISVGLRVGLGTLDRDLANIKKKIEPIEKEHFIPFKVGNVNVTEIKREIDKIARGKIPITVTPTLSAGAGRLLHREIQNQLKAAGPVKVVVTASITQQELAKLKATISKAAGGVSVTTATPATPAAQRQAAARSTPGGPSVASSPGATAAPAPRRTAREAHAATQAATQAAAPAPTPAAAPAPTRATRTAPLPPQSGRIGPIADFGGLPTGPAVGVSYAPDLETGRRRVVPEPTRGVGKRLSRAGQRAASVGVSMDTLKREKTHVREPETEAEIEYASRPTQVGLPLDEQAMFEQEKRGRGVRGASRSGARQRNEPILTAAEREAIGVKQDVMDEEAAAAADERIRKPGRKSRAYFGSTAKSPTARRLVSGLQFYRFDPILGDAFAALSDGELGEARALLRGFSSKLAGADPRQRRKFFKLFRNTENVPPELLEKHAALQGLFSEIGQQEATLRLGNAEAALKGFAKPKGPQAGWDETVRDHYKDLLGARQSAQRYLFDVLRGLRPRATGGPVVGGGLMARLAAAKAAKEAYLVGEHKPELFEGHSGKLEIVGEHGPEIRTFEESGKVHPTVPEWVRRGMAKDLTGRAPGGPVRGFGGRAFRSFAPGEKEAIAGGLLTRAGSEAVQRVFVVNWPAHAGGFVSQPAGASMAAGPMRFATDKDAEAFADSVGKSLKDLFGEQLQPKEPSPLAGGATLSAFERQQIGQQARERVSGLEARIGAARASTSEQQQLIPVRALSVAVGQIFSTLFGGRGDALTRAKQANELANRAQAATSRFRGEEVKLLDISSKLNKEQDPARQKAFIDARREQAKATRAAFLEARDLTDQAEKASASVIGQTGALRNLAAGTVGVIGGTLLFSTALGAVQAGLTATEKVLGPVIERMTGFQSTAAQVSASLADQVRQQGGATQSAVAASEAQAGLSKATADTINPLLQQRAQVEAGNKALTDSLALLHTFENTRARGGGAAGLTQTTGGALGTILGGVPSTSEQVGNELAGVPTQAPTGVSDRQAKLDAFIKKFGPPGATSADQLTGRALIGYKQLEISLGKESEAFDNSATRLQFFNDAIKKGGEGFQFVAQYTLPNLDANTRELAARAADAAGAFDIGRNIRDSKTILLDSFGKIVTSADGVTEALNAINTGLTTPDPDLLLKQLTERQIPAQRALFAAQGQFQRQTVNPAQFALQQIAAPTPGTTGGPAFSAGLVGIDQQGKVDQAAQKAADAYEKKVGSAVTFVNDQIAKGREQLVNLVPANLKGEFTDLLGEIESTGKAISDIQTDITQQQANLTIKEYNNQLRIAKRSLQDAKDLQAGINGETRNTLGGIEGQNIAMERQLQLLQFELQQRQINFRLATAGFVAPGTTPEERAARIEEAKKEAEFAQKQLDLQKQLAANQFKGVQITVGRDVTDLLAQISLLQQGRQLTINTAAASKALDILNKKQALLVEQAGTYIEEGVKITQAALDAAAQVQKETGKGFATILSKTAEAWGIFGDQAKVILQGLKGTAPTSTTKGHDAEGHVGGYASGIVGDTLGPTQITVGEAAGEKVAILKNPKLAPTSSLGYGGSGWGGGGSGGGPLIQMTVVISGNSIRSDTDLEQLAERVAAKTEERLMTKTSLFGLRRA